MLTFGSLFAGIGGFDLGFERAGLVCKWQVEVDPFCRKVLAKHWPKVPKWDDVRTFPTDKFDKVDIICGGDPCQQNSVAGSNNALQNRENLASQFIRVVQELRPKIVVRENPYRNRPDAVSSWNAFRYWLENLGYAVIAFRLRACCLGAIHQRDRVFLLGEDTHTDSYRLERRHGKGKRRYALKPKRSVHNQDWFQVHASRGLRSRNGFPNYVDRVRAIGNAVHPDVAEWIGRNLLESMYG